jgi:predicted nucleic acid-binding protein
VNRLFLDTTVLIDLSKDSGDVVTSLKALVATGAVLGVSLVSVAEYFAAVPVPERRRWQQRIADFEYWDISRKAALLAGAFRYDLAHQG